MNIHQADYLTSIGILEAEIPITPIEVQAEWQRLSDMWVPIDKEYWRTLWRLASPLRLSRRKPRHRF